MDAEAPTAPSIEIPAAPNIPQPPFWGVRVLKPADFDLREIFQYINRHGAVQEPVAAQDRLAGRLRPAGRDEISPHPRRSARGSDRRRLVRAEGCLWLLRRAGRRQRRDCLQPARRLEAGRCDSVQRRCVSPFRGSAKADASASPISSCRSRVAAWMSSACRA